MGDRRQWEATRCSGASRSGLEKEEARESQDRKPKGIRENQIEPEKCPDWYKARGHLKWLGEGGNQRGPGQEA